MRTLTLTLLACLPALAAPGGKTPVPLRDLIPRFVRGKSPLYRSRTARQAGLFVMSKRYRGLSLTAPGRVGFDVDGAFARLKVKVAVLDGSDRPVRFRVLGDGKPLAATPPLFSGFPPLALEVNVEGVILLELTAESEGPAGAAWIEGELFGAGEADLGRFRAIAASFSPEAYPASFKRRVNRAIDRAVGYLLVNQTKSGTWATSRSRPGTTALVALALLKAGVKRTDPGLARAFQYLRGQRFARVYDTAVLLMALEAAYFPRGADPQRAVEVIPGEDQVWIRDAAEWLARMQGAGFPKDARHLHPVWRYPGGGYDLSCTQYALFGLTAAERCGVAVGGVWLPALRYLLDAQQREAGAPVVFVSRYFRAGRFMRRRSERARARGFGYQLTHPPTGSMTSAGLCSLVLCQAALRRNARFQGALRSRTRAAVRDALAWLEEYLSLDENPFRGAAWWTYYLFNLERVGVLLDQRYLGTRDWYREGAERLMARQGPDGRIGDGLVDTAFALLFLKRATVPPLTQGR